VDFASGNPRSLGTPATPFGDSTLAGASKNNKATIPAQISASTLVNGGVGTNSLTTNFVAGDTITVDGTAITIVNTPTNLAANQINVTTGTIQDLLTNIGAITGVAPTITGGAITLHSGTANDLQILTTTTTAFGALGLTAPVNVPRTGGGTAGTGQVLGSDLQAFINESISGGAVTAYDISGSPVSLQLRWAKVDSSSLGVGHTDTCNMFYQVNSAATGTDVAWQNVNTDFTFSPNGQMTPAIAGITLTAPTIGGVPLGNVAINFGAGGVTQFADANGNVKVNQIQQDGFPAGSLQTVAIGQNGRVVGNYSNGRNIDLAQISVATFNGTNFLKRIDGGAFQATDQSGQALFGSGGTIVGSSLESSNTDIADEFTKLIVTQQAYSANTRVVTTSNQMVQDVLNMLR
jgi:flagellar hook protein FlgE